MSETEIVLLGVPFLIPLYIKQLFLAAIFGMLIGLEREVRGKMASLRTFSTICVGSCLFSLLSVEVAGGANAAPYDVTRIAAQIVTGIGFLGGGVIFKSSDRVEGITTGAMIWFTAGMGMACGFNQIPMMLWAFIMYALLNMIGSFIHSLFRLYRQRKGLENA